MSPKEKEESIKQVAEEAGQAIDDLMSQSDGVETPDESAVGTEPAETSARSASGIATVQAIARSTRVDRVLQVLLLCNLTLITGLIMFPTSSAPEPTPESKRPAFIGEGDTTQPDPFVQELRVATEVPTSQLWEHAVRAAGEGDYARAVVLLEQHLTTTHPMTDVEKRLIYNQLALYLVRDGRMSEAQEYERRSSQLMSRSYLPEDLLASAHKAAESGQLSQMRKAYARFLLQQKQIPPSLRKHIAEAYLRLGDSYRLEADGRGEPETPLPTANPAPGNSEGHE